MLPMLNFMYQYMDDTFNYRMREEHPSHTRISMGAGEEATFFQTSCFNKRVLVECALHFADHTPGRLRFDVTDLGESEARALADHLLQWFPLEMLSDRDARRKLALGMALHARLGKESALGRMGCDMLELVAKYV